MRHLSERAPLALLGLVLSVLCVGLMLLLASIKQPSTPPLVWDAVYERALIRAHSEQRPAVLLVTLPKCAACAALERETLTQPRVRKALKHFVLARHELLPDQTTVRIGTADVAIAGTPTLLFFDARGELQATPRIEGFVTPPALLRELANGSGRLFAPPGKERATGS